MAAPTIAALPPAPSRSEPATFSDRADIFVGALDDFRDDINALANWINNNAIVNNEVPDGTAGTPGYHFANDTDTGIYRPGANTIAFSTAGTHRGRFTSSGGFIVGPSGTPQQQEITVGLPDASGSPGIGFVSTTTDVRHQIYTSAGGAMVYDANVGGNASGTPYHSFRFDGSEAARLNANGLGLGGITNPARALHVGDRILTQGFQSLVDGSAGTPAFNFNADTNTGIFRQAENSIGFATAGIERMRVEQDNFFVNAGFGSLREAFVPRAWGYCNGSTGSPGFSGQGGFSGVSYQGSGTYRFTFAAAMPDVGYAVVATLASDNSYMPVLTLRTNNYFEITVRTSGGTVGGIPFCVAVFK